MQTLEDLKYNLLRKDSYFKNYLISFFNFHLPFFYAIYQDFSIYPLTQKIEFRLSHDNLKIIEKFMGKLILGF